MAEHPESRVHVRLQSSSQELVDLLSEIEDTARDADLPTSVSDSLSRMKRHASLADDRTARMLLDAIALGEDFASLYIQNLLEYPTRPEPCHRLSHPCS